MSTEIRQKAEVNYSKKDYEFWFIVLKENLNNPLFNHGVALY